ncbi:DUF1398 family protein [Pedobacter anseongensis]|uniref:DUF1398 family protein n=1 Tax=Pedobacter anseongensis TaxID=3133439 RepID=UPI003D753D43
MSSFPNARPKIAHSKVKSETDFSSYLKKRKALNVTTYEQFVSDGGFLRTLIDAKF